MTQRSFSSYLAWLIWLSVIPIVLLAVWLVIANIYERKEDMRLEAAHFAQNAISDIDDYLQSRIRALNMLAISPLADEPGGLPELYRQAQAFRASFQSHVVLADVGDPMQMIFNTRSPFGTSLPTIPRPVGHAAAPKALETGQPAVGDTFMGPIAHKKLVAIAVPGLRGGEVTHIIISPLEADELQKRFDNIALPEKWILTLTDGVGDVIARRAPGGFETAQELDGAERFQLKSGISPWTITLEIPEPVFQAPLVEAATSLGITVLLATLVGVFGGRLAGRRLNRQVKALSEAPKTAHPSDIKEIADAHELLNAYIRDLRQSEAIHRELFEASPQPMWVFDSETLAFLEVNEAAIRHYGYSREAFQKMTLKHIRPEEDLPHLFDILARASDGLNDVVTARHYTSDSRLIDVEVRSHRFAYMGRRAELVAIHDVTERNRIQNALRTSEAEFRTLIEILPQIVWVTRPDGWCIDFNQPWLDYTGLTLEESLGFGWNPPFHPEDRGRAAERWLQATSSGEPYEIEYRLRRWDGIYHWMLGRAQPMRDAEGNIVKWFGTCTDIDDLKRTQERLDEAQRIGKIGDWEYNVVTEGTTWSPEVYRIFERDSRLGPPRDFDENAMLFDSESVVLLREMVGLGIASGQTQKFDLRTRGVEGKASYVQIVAVPRKDDGGQIVGLFGTAQDITDRKQAELALQARAQQQLLLAALGRVALSGANLDEMYAEAASAIIRGLRVEFSSVLLLDGTQKSLVLKAGVGWKPGWIGQPVADPTEQTHTYQVLTYHEPVIVDDRDESPRFTPSELLTSHGVISGIDVLVGGAENPVGVLGAYASTPCKFSTDDVGFLQGVANTLSVAAVRQQANEQLSFMALHDSLTNLPNRTLLTDRLNIALSHAERHGQKIALLFLDLDRFKHVNDVFGHALGDDILQEVAKRLLHCVRSEDTVSRQGGDEFILALTGVVDEHDAALIAEKILRAITSPFILEGTEIIMGISIGIACFPHDGEDTETLLRNADAAMYVAKDLGRNRYQFYSSEMNMRALDRLTLESDLHHAIERNELFLMYQPQLALGTGKVLGLEALVRWRHPTRGLIPPGQFIPVAEDCGQILPVGNWVLESACDQHARWVSLGLTQGAIAVNISAHQFRQADFCDRVADVLLRTGIQPELLELEVTESVVMQGIDRVLHKLNILRELGVKLAIDDFGTGYSSLSYLKQFPLHRLKIDQSFTQGLPDDQESGAIAKAIIQMGHSLGLDVLAEGIETKEQQNHLRTLGCDAGQGYLYAKPLSVEECEEYLRTTGWV